MVVEHAWNTRQAIQWGETTILDQARRHPKLRIKEALHTLMIPFDQHLNRDEALEQPGCWTAMMKHMGGGANFISASPQDVCIFLVQGQKHCYFSCACSLYLALKPLENLVEMSVKVVCPKLVYRELTIVVVLKQTENLSLQSYRSIIGYTNTQESIIEPQLSKAQMLQDHPVCRTHFSQCQTLSAMLGQPGMWVLDIIHVHDR